MKDYSAKKPSSNHTLLKVILLAVLLVAVFAGAFVLYVFSKVNTPRTYFSEEKVFSIEKGESVSSVARRLEEEGIISSGLVFKVYAAFKNLSGQVQAGSFKLDSAMTLKEVLKLLTEGRGLADEISVTFLEGNTLEEYARLLEERGLVSSAEFLAVASSGKFDKEYEFLSDKPAGRSLEGYLFPDTYNFKKGASAEEIIRKMLNNFGRKFNDDLRREARKQGKSIFEIVIMASLVEGEVGRNLKPGSKLSVEDLQKLSEERRLVAGVFYNRLRAGRALESDATISYITGNNRAAATLEETRMDHPYNTYRNPGLPPGPINNPSLDAILAAVYPAETDYFYFLSKPSGEVVFSRTFEEHVANKAKFLK